VEPFGENLSAHWFAKKETLIFEKVSRECFSNKVEEGRRGNQSEALGKEKRRS